MECLAYRLNDFHLSYQQLYSCLDCLGNIAQLGGHHELLYNQNVISNIRKQLQLALEKMSSDQNEDIENLLTIGFWTLKMLLPSQAQLDPTEFEIQVSLGFISQVLEIGCIPLDYLHKCYEEPLVFMLSILKTFYSHFEIEQLINDGYLQIDLVSKLMEYYTGTGNSILKCKILGLLQEFLQDEYREYGFDFGVFSFFTCLKNDITQQLPQVEDRRKFFELFERVCEFFGKVFSYNDSKTNNDICSQLEFHYVIAEGFVNYQDYPKVV